MVMVATWDDSESEFEEETDVANLWFMASDEHLTKINSELKLENCDLTMDMLVSAFEELQEC